MPLVLSHQNRFLSVTTCVSWLPTGAMLIPQEIPDGSTTESQQVGGGSNKQESIADSEQVSGDLIGQSAGLLQQINMSEQGW